ncbi:MAG: SsrA-binding protein SmpB [Magnetococcales bacterium]|nr:SsrA-binding protein SmpB [Magnetococcales bacterium]
MGIKIIADNRKARFRYEVLDRFEAGVVLVGTEVKSLRAGNLTISESYAYVRKNQLYWLNATIPEYKHGNIHNHEPQRTRKLLAHQKEIKRLIGAIKEKGLTLVPLKAYWKRGKVKVEIGICRGKKLHDKRATQKDRDWGREKQRLLKHNV